MQAGAGAGAAGGGGAGAGAGAGAKTIVQGSNYICGGEKGMVSCSCVIHAYFSSPLASPPAHLPLISIPLPPLSPPFL